jgi:hypothetical protein
MENSLHWIMDMLVRDDECRVRADHAPANFTAIKHMAHNLLGNAPVEGSLHGRAKLLRDSSDGRPSVVSRYTKSPHG